MAHGGLGDAAQHPALQAAAAVAADHDQVRGRLGRGLDEAPRRTLLGDLERRRVIGVRHLRQQCVGALGEFGDDVVAQAAGRTLKARLQVRGFDAIAQLVEAGLGVAVLPAVVAQRFARIFAVQPLVLLEDWARRPYLLAVRTQEVLPAVVQRFVESLCPASVPDTPAPAAAAPQSHPRPRTP